MVIDIKMCRFDNVPWGFRLVGGADFEYPLTVVKVTEASIAEEAGLKVGDVIVRINDTAATPLTHEETNKIIQHCGNVFYFGVYREEAEVAPKHFPIIGAERATTPDSFLTVGSSCKSPSSELQCDECEQQEFLPDLADRPCSALSESAEIKLVEDEIAAVLSGESEMLKEHNLLGIFPKPGVCMTSDVLRTLNEEAIKTKAEKDKENKKWTTFLQKPNRPIPKSKAQVEAERRAANAYKVKIVKSAPKTAERSATPAPPEVTEVAAVPEEKEEVTAALVVPETAEAAETEMSEAAPSDSEVPNLEEATVDASIAEAEHASDIEKADEEKEASPEHKPAEEDNQQTEQAELKAINEEVEAPTKTAEELALERQLASVQQQLAALSSLPSTIQATLDAVTKQLAELLPTFKLQQPTPQQQSAENEVREVSLERIEEDEDVEKGTQEVAESVANEEVAQECETTAETKQALESNDEETNKDNKETQCLEPLLIKDEVSYAEMPENLKKQKRHDVIEELEEHLERKQNPQRRRSKRAFGPLTPSSERPVVLPGGRRWYRPKDAYNDEFIAETLSAQAELITGTTLGVNFMKYQKPEKKIDLHRSEVYKVIHHLDRQPVRGIEVRPPVVPAEVDIKKPVPA